MENGQVRDGLSFSSSVVPYYFCDSCGLSWVSSCLVPHGGVCCGKNVGEVHIEKADAKKLEQPTIRVASSKRGQEQNIGKYSNTARTGQQEDLNLEQALETEVAATKITATEETPEHGVDSAKMYQPAFWQEWSPMDWCDGDCLYADPKLEEEPYKQQDYKQFVRQCLLREELEYDTYEAVGEVHIEKADAKKLEQPTIRVARSKRGQEQDIGKYSKSARTGQQQDGRTGQQQEWYK